MLSIQIVAFVGAVLVASLVSIRNARAAVAAAFREARTDALTGIGNARGWHERTEELVRCDAPFAFVLFDVGNLKAINSALGHAQADHVLRQVASLIRVGDVIGNRTGGDEFAIALPAASEAQARAVRDRIEGQVGELEVAPGVLAFLVGNVGTWSPGEQLEHRITAADLELEERKLDRKRRLGLPLTRQETLDLVEC